MYVIDGKKSTPPPPAAVTNLSDVVKKWCTQKNAGIVKTWLRCVTGAACAGLIFAVFLAWPFETIAGKAGCGVAVAIFVLGMMLYQGILRIAYSLSMLREPRMADKAVPDDLLLALAHAPLPAEVKKALGDHAIETGGLTFGELFSIAEHCEQESARRESEGFQALAAFASSRAPS